MQFYVNGYKPGDPLVAEPHPSVLERSGDLPEEVDVLIVGTGPAGLILAAQLARFPEIRTAVVERRDGPLARGQADGVACRSVEIFETFGLASRLVHEAYWVNEVCFWQPDPADRTKIARAGRVLDTEADLSEFPHVIVNQARLLAYLLEDMERSASRLVPFYHCQATDLEIDAGGVTVAVDDTETGATKTVRAAYVVGCDGARSAVRTAIGRELVGDAMNVSWGVMDVLPSTDFPDIRLKCTIQSAEAGSILLIPREGGYLVRLYVGLDPEQHRRMLESGGVTPEKLIGVVNEVLHPYTLEARDVGWWSVYEIGQRLCDRFDDVPAAEAATRLPRVFIAGDACHTHSAKAGQGMNVSMADTFNLGWKLIGVLRGTVRPEILRTYSDERQAVAQELIDFDEEWSRMLSSPLKSPDDPASEGVDPEKFQSYFVQHAKYTAGVATRYAPSILTGVGRFQQLAKGFGVGMRFPSAPAVRLADARAVELGHGHRADAAWRLYVFGDAPSPVVASSRARRLLEFLGSEGSPLARFTPAGAEPDAVVDVRAVFQQHHRDLQITDLPPVLRPRKGRFGLVDYEKVFCPDPNRQDLFDLRGVDREAGAMVLVRPDQHVAEILPLEAHDELGDFLEPILIAQR